MRVDVEPRILRLAVLHAVRDERVMSACARASPHGCACARATGFVALPGCVPHRVLRHDRRWSHGDTHARTPPAHTSRHWRARTWPAHLGEYAGRDVVDEMHEFDLRVCVCARAHV
jgi:hypothetical protein